MFQIWSIKLEKRNLLVKFIRFFFCIKFFFQKNPQSFLEIRKSHHFSWILATILNKISWEIAYIIFSTEVFRCLKNIDIFDSGVISWELESSKIKTLVAPRTPWNVSFTWRLNIFEAINVVSAKNCQSWTFSWILVNNRRQNSGKTRIFLKRGSRIIVRGYIWKNFVLNKILIFNNDI